MIEVFVANEQETSVDELRLSALARHTLECEGVSGDAELSVLLVTSDHIRNLNMRFANENNPTDVLAFPMLDEEEDEEETLLGDVVVCPEVAEQSATKLGHSLSHELDVLLVHGTLHLLGYDHQGDEDKTRMDARLFEILETFTRTPA
jgi:probable rRNA maturation factor